MIPAHIIDEIRNKAEIVQIISEYVKLKKRGKNYVGLCPFHSEKDGSFTVSPEKQFFHCFGCNEGGNVFAFIMKIENIGFAEAVAELGAKLGIAVPQVNRHDPNKSEKEKIYQVMLLAAKYYHESLNNQGEAAAKYLAKRNLNKETITKFGLGYAPSGWDNLFNYLVSRGVAPELIAKSGLALKREKQSGYYDRFRNRLIFPVIDQRNRVLAFGGRSLGEEEPKYLNSPDTLIYHKGQTLFGLNITKDHIKQAKTAVMVEGYFDLITPFQAGITNLAATLGTALTINQCKLLARYCDTIILAFDADSAGGIAAERSIELMKQQGLKVKVAQLSGGKDPDEIINKQGKAFFSNCLETALPYLEFKIKRTLARYNIKEIEARATALREVAGILSQEKDPFIQKEYASLAANLLKIGTENLLSEIKRLSHYKQANPNKLRRTTAKPNSKVIEAEKCVLALAAQDKTALKFLKESLKVKDFSQREARAIAELLLNTEFEPEADPGHFLIDNLPDEQAKNFLSKIIISEDLRENNKKEAVLNDCIKVIKDEQFKNKLERLKLEIKEAEQAGELKKATELLAKLKSEIS